MKGKIAVAKITDKGADKYLRVIDQEGESIIGPSNEPQSIASQRDEDETRAPEDTVDDVWMTLHKIRQRRNSHHVGTKTHEAVVTLDQSD